MYMYIINIMLSVDPFGLYFHIFFFFYSFVLSRKCLLAYTTRVVVTGKVVNI